MPQIDAAARYQLLIIASRLARAHPGQQGFTEQQVQALTVLHAAATQAGGGGDRQPALDGAATVLAALLDWCVGFRRRPLEQRPWSRMYVALLRACAAVFAEVRVPLVVVTSTQVRLAAYTTQLKGLPDPVSLPYVAPCLCTFFNYGLAPSNVAAAPVTTSPAPCSRGSRYIPPHQRHSTGSDGGSSDGSSSTSDSDGCMSDPLRSSRVRSAALQALQALARCDPKGMHSVWPEFMPSSGQLAPTGIAGCLQDPEPRVRTLAATVLTALLDGPQQRAFMAMAALPDARHPTRFGTETGTQCCVYST